MIPYPFQSTYGKTILRDLTKSLASVVLQADIAIRRHLSNLYILGTPNEEDYAELHYTGDLPYRIPQAYGEYLDRLGYMFNVKRRLFEQDEFYRQRIIFAMKQSTTINGLKATLKFALENSPIFFYNGKTKTRFDVEIRETYKDHFDGVSSGLNAPLRGDKTHLYGIIIYIKPTRAFNVNYKAMLNNSEFSNFRHFLDTVTAAGIRVERVVFQQSGTGGNKGEYYAYPVEGRLT